MSNTQKEPCGLAPQSTLEESSDRDSSKKSPPYYFSDETENADFLSKLDIGERTFYIALDNTALLLAELFEQQIPKGLPFHMPNFTVGEDPKEIVGDDDDNEFTVAFSINSGTETERIETWKALDKFVQQLQEASSDYSEEMAVDDELQVVVNAREFEISLSATTVEYALEITRILSVRLEIESYDDKQTRYAIESRDGKSLQEVFQGLNLDSDQRDTHLRYMPPKPYLSVAEAFCTAHSIATEYPDNGIQGSFDRVEAQISQAYGVPVGNPRYSLH
ncbi:MAG: hypothetical protein PHX61_04195 [Alphaproteobacteria bacterium]|nr:hypothetical protein [Alphaproteobacteria bacterium]